MPLLKFKYLLILILAAGAAGLLYLYKSENQRPKLASPVSVESKKTEFPKNNPPEKISANTVTAEKITECLSKSGTSGDCLDNLFGAYLKNHTSIEALSLAEKLGNENSTIRLSCHPVVHAIGRETFLIKKTVQDSFPACDQTCHSGCYHGVMERFLRGDLASSDEVAHITEEEIKEKARTACDPSQPLRFRFQCLHGLGHALMFFLEYDLQGALNSCDTLPDPWSRSSCYGGVFMENVFSATPEKRDLSKTDYHYPCSKLETKYESDCYMMQTTRMSEMGLNTTQLFEECKKADLYQQICVQSIGRDLSNKARIGDPKPVAQKCGQVSGSDRQACTRGVVYALEDNTWSGKYGFPFCASFSNETDQEICFNMAKGYLVNTFETTQAQIISQCEKFAPSSKICTQI